MVTDNQEIKNSYDIDADNFWNSLSYEDKCNAFHAVVSRIVQGAIVEDGSYRYMLYDVFEFDADMYSRGIDCGFMALHNCSASAIRSMWLYGMGMESNE